MTPMLSLSAVYLNLTTACNLRCRYCFIEAGLPQPNELTTEEVISVLDEVAAMGADKVTLTGGEPLLRTDFLDIARHAASLQGRGISRLSLVTNAMLVSKDLAHSIMPLFSAVNVSIDGFDAAHDSVRGRGSFGEAIRGLRLLVNAGIEPTVFITLTQGNVASLGRILDFLYRDETIHYFKIRPLWRFGRALKYPDLSIEGDELAKLGFPSQSGHDSFVSGDTEEAGPLGYSINVHSDGSIYPCHLLRYPEFVAGNIRARPLAEIYHDSHVFRTLRSWGIRCCQQAKQPRESLLKRLREHTENRLELEQMLA